MGKPQLTVLRMIALIGLIGAALLAVLGVATLAQSKGGSVLGVLAALSVALGELVFAAAVAVPAALLLRATSVLSALGYPRTPASFGVA